MAVIAEKGSGRQKRQLAKRLGILTDAQFAAGWFVILALAALVGTIYLSQASSIAASGRKVQILQNSLVELKRDNAMLERTIAEAQTLDRLQQEAVSLGFVRAEPADLEYLVVSQYPAVPPPTPVSFGAGEGEAAQSLPDPAQSFTEAVRLTLRDSLEHMVMGQAGQ